MRRFPAAVAVYALFVGTLLVLPINGPRLWDLAEHHLRFPYTPTRETLVDLAVNVMLFMPLGFVVHRWRRGTTSPSRGSVGRTLLIAAAVSATMEAVQAVIPWRFASVLDVPANVTGAAAGIGFDTLLATVGRRSTLR